MRRLIPTTLAQISPIGRRPGARGSDKHHNQQCGFHLGCFRALEQEISARKLARSPSSSIVRGLSSRQQSQTHLVQFYRRRGKQCPLWVISCRGPDRSVMSASLPKADMKADAQRTKGQLRTSGPSNSCLVTFGSIGAAPPTI